MSTYDYDVIFTVESRGNVFLQAVTSALGLEDGQVFEFIQSSAQELKSYLAKKNIKYADLKGALVPNTNKNEQAFVFDWRRIESPFYGKAIVELMLPIFDRRSTHSILCGDWINRGEHNQWLCGELVNSLIGNTEPYIGKGEDLCFVYVNNLSDSIAMSLQNGLQACPGYLGFLNLNFMSPIKACLSMLLVRAFIKHKNFIIQGHEDDRSAAEDVNLLNYEFEKFNYKVRSFSSCLYGMFLSYKIERPIFEHGDLDSRFSLNAISNRPLDLDEFSVELDERKLQYLQSQKSGSLKCANLSALSASQIAGQIRQKVQQNYIYNLARSTNGKTVKFNVVIENKGLYRNQCAVEYLPSEKILRLITFF